MAKLKSGFAGERAIILPATVIEDLKKDALGSLLHITDIGFYPQAGFHYRKRTQEEAKQYILIYCIAGEGWMEIDSVRQKVQADHFVILPKGKAHAYGCNKLKPWTIYWLHFDGEKADFFSEGLDTPTAVNPERNSRIEDRLQLFEEIYATLRNGYSKNNLEYSIASLFHFLGSFKFLGTYRDSLSGNQIQNDVIDISIHFMRENIHNHLKLKQISDNSNLSLSHFSYLFQKKTGLSPLNYFSQLKIQHACHLLDFSDMKINQIAMTIGYEDPFYFSRIFSKIMGVSPSNYRSKKKG